MAKLSDSFREGVSRIGVAMGKFKETSKRLMELKQRTSEEILLGAATCAVDAREAGAHLKGCPQGVSRSAKEMLVETGHFGNDIDSRSCKKMWQGIRKAAGWGDPGKVIAAAVKEHGEYNVQNVLLAFRDLNIKSQNNLENFTGITLSEEEKLADICVEKESGSEWDPMLFLFHVAEKRKERAKKAA